MMKTLRSSLSIQLQQTKQQLVYPDQPLSHELGYAVQRLPPLYTRLLAGGISLLFISAIAWATFSKVDEVAVAQGQLIPTNPVQPMRALTSGRLVDVKVNERQHVQKGSVLLQLDPAISEAEVQRLEQQLKLKQEDLARLEAEKEGNHKPGSNIQNQLLAARLREYHNRRAMAMAEVQRQLSAVKAAALQVERLRLDLSYASTKEQSLKSLIASGAVPRLDYLDARNKVTALEKEIAMQTQQLEQAKQTYHSSKESVSRLEAEQQSEILTQINTLKQEIANLQGQFSQAKEEQKLTTIEAPITGIVYNVQVNQTGGAIQAGEELLSIVPDGEDLILEVKVSNRDIGFITEKIKDNKERLSAKVKLETFPYQEFGTLKGQLESVSPNAISDKDGNFSYMARIRLIDAKQNSIKLGNRTIQLLPGMVVTADIVVRQKTILTFLLDPIIVNWNQAFSVR